MNVHSLDLRNVLSHVHTHVDFPKKGIVVVTGPNGAGKSTIPEAVAVALWGKTLRGTSPWSGDAGAVGIVFDAHATAVRDRRGGKVSLAWTDGTAAEEYENTAKAQAALERLVGPFDVWRRCSVFSSSDAAHFTLATDAERKRLLEAILGIGRFDEALAACRVDLKQVKEEATEHAYAHQRASDMLIREQAARDEAKRMLEGAGGLKAPDVKGLIAESQRLATLYTKARGDVRDVGVQISKARETGAADRATLAAVQKALDRIKSDVCPTCNRKIDSKDRKVLEDRSVAEAAKVEATAAKVSATVQGLEEQLEELNEEVEALANKYQRAQDAANSAQAQASSRDKMSEMLTRALDAIVTHAQARDAAATKAKAAGTRVGVLTAVEKVLGTKGVRAHVLSRALSGLEAVANGWLGRIAGDHLALKLNAYTETKTAGVSDSISLEVEGAGNGHGYRASSAGERRRIDVALLLALGEVASAAHGHEPGTLFVDEVFDALDEEGVDRVVSTVRDLAEDRCVVVITHNPLIVEAIGPDVHWKIEAGCLTA